MDRAFVLVLFQFGRQIKFRLQRFDKLVINIATVSNFDQSNGIFTLSHFTIVFFYYLFRTLDCLVTSVELSITWLSKTNATISGILKKLVVARYTRFPDTKLFFILPMERLLVSMETASFSMHWVSLILVLNIPQWNWTSGHCTRMELSWQFPMNNRYIFLLFIFTMEELIFILTLDQMMALH